MGDVQPGKLDLLWTIRCSGLRDDPVVQWPMVFELERANRMCDTFNRIRKRMSKVIRRIHRPRPACPIVRSVADAVKYRIP